MTLEEMRVVLIPMALALRADFDPPTQRAYHRVLKDVPAVLAVAALEDLIAAGLRFMPTAPEILTASEKSRRQQLAAYPYEGCIECEAQRGYRTVLGGDWQKTVQPCPCKARHRARLAQLGLLEPMADLPGESGSGDERVYPTLEQLPERLRARLTQVSAQKVLS